MAQRGVDIVLVRRSGPVQTMTFRAWWLHFLWLIIFLMVAALVVGGYVLFRQHQTILALAEDTHLVMLRTERLESLADEQETREILALQAAEQKAYAEKNRQKKPARPKPAVRGKTNPDQVKSTEAKPKENAVRQPEETNKPTPPSTEAASSLAPDPYTSDRVAIRDVIMTVTNSNLLVRFKVANARDPSDKAIGYVAVLVHGMRYGKPLIEAWPPMRLSPLGRPINYRRGTPFSVQYHRPLKAVFFLGDKELDQLEFLVYSREGNLLLLQKEALDIEKRLPGQKENS